MALFNQHEFWIFKEIYLHTVFQCRVMNLFTTTLQCLRMLINIFIWKVKEKDFGKLNSLVLHLLLLPVWGMGASSYTEVWTKMADICRQHFQMHFLLYFALNSIEYCNNVSEGSMDNNSAVVQEMAWHWTGGMQLSIPMMTQFTKACMHH